MVLLWRRSGRAGGCRDSWGCSSVGRAPALQAGGHEFESHHLHESNEENVRGGQTTPSERIYADELGDVWTRGDSKNTRDEQMEHLRIPGTLTPITFHRTLKTAY